MNTDIYNKLELLRKKALLTVVIGIGCLIMMIVLFCTYSPLGLASAVCVAVFIYLSVKRSDEYTDYFKSNVVKAVIEEAFDNVTYEPEAGIDEGVIEQTGMICIGNRYSSNDYIKGAYNGVAFEQADVCIQNITSSGKHTTTTTTTYFKGRWYIIEFNKSFRYDLQIKEKSFAYAKKGKGSGLFPSEQEKKQKLHKVKFEDASFNSRFLTYAASDEEAFYIVTPQFMQALADFDNSFNGDLLLAFVVNKLHLAFNDDNDAFEPSVFGKNDIEASERAIKRDLSVLTEFVDRLKLNNDLFK